MISAIRWVSDLITHLGAVDIFREESFEVSPEKGLSPVRK